MDDARKQKAYFRFGVISPLLGQSPEETLAARLTDQAKKQWQLPDGTQRRFSASTIEEWLYRYRSGGLDALVDLPRRDLATFPGVSEPVVVAAQELFRVHPDVRTGTLYELLKRSGTIRADGPGRSTFYRWAAANRPVAVDAPSRERRAFEASWSNALWQADIMYGPLIPCKGRDGRRRQTQTYLTAVLDDHSRLLCHGQFSFSQAVEDWMVALRTACCRRGIPERLYCDNGKVFTSPQVHRIGACLGVHILHTAVRDAAAKGKIERFFRTVRTRFLDPLQIEGMPADLDALNRAFRAWVETHYNGSVHSAHGQTPLTRWVEGARKLRTLNADEADNHFLFETLRTVHKDGTFSLNALRFETDWTLSGQRVLLRYEPLGLTRVDVWFDSTFRGRASRLDPQINARLSREGAPRP